MQQSRKQGIFVIFRCSSSHTGHARAKAYPSADCAQTLVIFDFHQMAEVIQGLLAQLLVQEVGRQQEWPSIYRSMTNRPSTSACAVPAG